MWIRNEKGYSEIVKFQLVELENRSLTKEIGEVTKLESYENIGIIFDLDGTLWDASKQVVPAWNRVLDLYPQLHKHITETDMQGFMGKTLDTIAGLMFPNLDEKESLKILRECCQEEQIYLQEHGGTLYPNLEKTLMFLQDKYKLFIVSNCQDGYVQAFLNHHGLGRYFTDYEMSGRTGQIKGENIKLILDRNHLTKAVYVGDTQGDMEAAIYAGVPFIYAKYGFGNLNCEENVIYYIEQIIDCADKIFAIDN